MNFTKLSLSILLVLIFSQANISQAAKVADHPPNTDISQPVETGEGDNQKPQSRGKTIKGKVSESDLQQMIEKGEVKEIREGSNKNKAWIAGGIGALLGGLFALSRSNAFSQPSAPPPPPPPIPQPLPPMPAPAQTAPVSAPAAPAPVSQPAPAPVPAPAPLPMPSPDGPAGGPGVVSGAPRSGGNIVAGNVTAAVPSGGVLRM